MRVVWDGEKHTKQETNKLNKNLLCALFFVNAIEISIVLWEQQSVLWWKLWLAWYYLDKNIKMGHFLI